MIDIPCDEHLRPLTQCITDHALSRSRTDRHAADRLFQITEYLDGLQAKPLLDLIAQLFQ